MPTPSTPSLPPLPPLPSPPSFTTTAQVVPKPAAATPAAGSFCHHSCYSGFKGTCEDALKVRAAAAGICSCCRSCSAVPLCDRRPTAQEQRTANLTAATAARMPSTRVHSELSALCRQKGRPLTPPSPPLPTTPNSIGKEEPPHSVEGPFQGRGRGLQQGRLRRHHPLLLVSAPSPWLGLAVDATVC